ncbi:unnamed protein product [Pleuronectes platessa]|uniref:Uncharacterized protein n=1 Tax=Pleuronectes platessa TaxID=8262 RepID=A0A9N7Z9Z6_PLEPL|nr:unnamed protein product [Pleuronectes platessa]
MVLWNPLCADPQGVTVIAGGGGEKPEGFIDLDGPVGMVLAADRDTRESAISQTQPAHYPPAHHNSCLVPAQGLGCSCTIRHEEEEEEEENSEGRDRAPVTRTGWGLSSDTGYFSVVTRRGISVRSVA